MITVPSRAARGQVLEKFTTLSATSSAEFQRSNAAEMDKLKTFATGCNQVHAAGRHGVADDLGSGNFQS